MMKHIRTALAFALALSFAASAFAAPDNALIMGGKNGLVVTTHPLADMAGQKILDSGGNAIDAAVAAGYALAVVHPQAGNIGGGGFAVIPPLTARTTLWTLGRWPRAQQLAICTSTIRAT